MAFSASQSPIHTPYVEMLPKVAQTSHFFGEEDADFKGGMLTVSGKPGFGFNIDDSRADSETLLEF